MADPLIQTQEELEQWLKENPAPEAEGEAYWTARDAWDKALAERLGVGVEDLSAVDMTDIQKIRKARAFSRGEGVEYPNPNLLGMTKSLGAAGYRGIGYRNNWYVYDYSYLLPDRIPGQLRVLEEPDGERLCGVFQPERLDYQRAFIRADEHLPYYRGFGPHYWGSNGNGEVLVEVEGGVARAKYSRRGYSKNAETVAMVKLLKDVLAVHLSPESSQAAKFLMNASKATTDKEKLRRIAEHQVYLDAAQEGDPRIIATTYKGKRRGRLSRYKP